MKPAALLLFLVTAWIANSQEVTSTESAGKYSTMSVVELTVLAEKGDPAAQFRLGVIFHTGEGAPKDEAKAAKWSLMASESYRKAIAADAQFTAMRERKKAAQISLAKGSDYEKTHQWREAREAYIECLNFEPDHTEAKDLLLRVEAVIADLAVYEKYIVAAEELANKADFQKAIRRFNDAMATKPSYLANSDRVERLHALLLAQNKPVEVAFKSDGKTWVSIQNYRTPSKLGAPVVLKLLPGDYKIIGRRHGFQDVTLPLQIRSGTNPPIVTVECTVAASPPLRKIDDKQDNLAQERIYQTALAKSRAEEAIASATFDEEIAKLKAKSTTLAPK